MKRVVLLCLFVCAVAHTAAAGELIRHRQKIPGDYIVRFRDDFRGAAEDTARELGRAHGVKVSHVYSAAIKGFAFHGSDHAAVALSRNPNVLYVEEDAPLTLTGVQSPAQSTGLDRIDQRNLPLDNAYIYQETGAGSVIYVMDTGVNYVSELNGRIALRRGYVTNAESVLDPSADDCQNHGTATAVVAAGSTYGVAKNATVVSLRIFPCSGDAKTSDTVKAFDDIYTWHTTGAFSSRAVLNLSWIHGNFTIQALNDSIDKLVNAGVTVAAAAGGVGWRACDSSPANKGALNGVLTVSSSSYADEISGAAGPTYPGPLDPCGVEIFAPADVASLNKYGTPITYTGTSSSTPFVAGVAALVQERHSTSNPAQIESIIKSNATVGVLRNLPAGMPNLLLFWSGATIDISTAGSVYASATTTASVTPVPGATNYIWAVDNGTIISGQGTPNLTWRAGCGTFSVLRVSVPTSSGTKEGTVTVPMILPSASVSGSATINYGQNATLNVNLNGVGPWQVTWSDGVQQTYNASPGFRTVTPSETTTYRALSVRDGGGCAGTTSGTATITVTGCSPASTAIETPPSNYSSGQSWARVPAVDGATYTWSIGNGALLTHTNTNQINYRLGCSGVTTIYVTITKACGTQSSGSTTATIVPPTANAWGSTTISAGETATIAAQYTGTLPWSVTWSDGYQEFNITSAYHYREVTPEITTTYTIIDVRNSKWCPGTATGSATVNVQ